MSMASDQLTGGASNAFRPTACTSQCPRSAAKNTFSRDARLGQRTTISRRSTDYQLYGFLGRPTTNSNRAGRASPLLSRGDRRGESRVRESAVRTEARDVQARAIRGRSPRVDRAVSGPKVVRGNEGDGSRRVD